MINNTGTGVTSTVGGIYDISHEDVANGVAVTTPVSQVTAAAGVTDAAFYFCGNQNKAVNDTLNTAADSQGKTVVSYVVGDFYKIFQDGVVTSVRTTTKPLQMVFGIPLELRNEKENEMKKAFSVLLTNPITGEVVVYGDTDNDPWTRLPLMPPYLAHTRCI